MMFEPVIEPENKKKIQHTTAATYVNTFGLYKYLQAYDIIRDTEQYNGGKLTIDNIRGFRMIYAHSVLSFIQNEDGLNFHDAHTALSKREPTINWKKAINNGKLFFSKSEDDKVIANPIKDIIIEVFRKITKYIEGGELSIARLKEIRRNSKRALIISRGYDKYEELLPVMQQYANPNMRVLESFELKRIMKVNNVTDHHIHILENMLNLEYDDTGSAVYPFPTTFFNDVHILSHNRPSFELDSIDHFKWGVLGSTTSILGRNKELEDPNQMINAAIKNDLDGVHPHAIMNATSMNRREILKLCTEYGRNYIVPRCLVYTNEEHTAVQRNAILARLQAGSNGFFFIANSSSKDQVVCEQLTNHFKQSHISVNDTLIVKRTGSDIVVFEAGKKIEVKLARLYSKVKPKENEYIVWNRRSGDTRTLAIVKSLGSARHMRNLDQIKDASKNNHNFKFDYNNKQSDGKVEDKDLLWIYNFSRSCKDTWKTNATQLSVLEKLTHLSHITLVQNLEWSGIDTLNLTIDIHNTLVDAFDCICSMGNKYSHKDICEMINNGVEIFATSEYRGVNQNIDMVPILATRLFRTAGGSRNVKFIKLEHLQPGNHNKINNLQLGDDGLSVDIKGERVSFNIYANGDNKDDVWSWFDDTDRYLNDWIERAEKAESEFVDKLQFRAEEQKADFMDVTPRSFEAQFKVDHMCGRISDLAAKSAYMTFAKKADPIEYSKNHKRIDRHLERMKKTYGGCKFKRNSYDRKIHTSFKVPTSARYSYN